MQIYIFDFHSFLPGENIHFFKLIIHIIINLFFIEIIIYQSNKVQVFGYTRLVLIFSLTLISLIQRSHCFKFQEYFIKLLLLLFILEFFKFFFIGKHKIS